MSDETQEAAAAVMESLGFAGAEAPEEGEQPPAAAPEPAQETAEEEQEDEFDPASLLETEDPEDIDLSEDDTPLAEEPAEEEYVPYEQYDDDDTAKLRSELHRERKRREFLESQRLRDQQPKWAQEAKKRYPLAVTEDIQATSRRGFLRAAKAQHEAVMPVVRPIIDAYEKKLASEKETMTGRIRAELEQAWGKPTSGPQVAQQTTGDLEERMREADQKRDLKGAIGVLMREGKVRI